jgi:hypothetical protein
MDKIYLGRSDGYIYIDETGTNMSAEKNFYIKNHKNIFTLAPLVLSLEDLGAVLSHSGNYILLDQMSKNRIEYANKTLYDGILKEYNLIFDKKDG